MAPIRKHILLTSFPAFGHIIPMLELAKKISVYHEVTFAVAVEKIGQIHAREILSEHDNVNLFAIQDGYTEDDYPDEPIFGQAFVDLLQSVLASVEKFSSQFTKATGEAGPVDSGSELRPIDMVIADNFVIAPLVTKACCEQDIPIYHFNTGNSGLAAMFLSIDENTPSIKTDDMTPPLFIPPKSGEPYPPIAEFMLKCFLPVGQTIHLTKGIIANTALEMEADIIDCVKQHPKMTGLEFHTVGPLVPLEKEVQGAKLAKQALVAKWLDQQVDKSVIYVSHGTLGHLQPPQLKVLATALLNLKRPFIWSLPARVHHFLPETIMNTTKHQFETSGSPYLVLDWAPQKLILQHRAIAVFLSHCGWNSLIEAVSYGVPVVGWPLFADQLMNAMWLVDKGAGLLIEGTSLKSEVLIPEETIHDMILEAAGWKDSDGNKYRQAAEGWSVKLMRALGPNGSSNKGLRDIVNF